MAATRGSVAPRRRRRRRAPVVFAVIVVILAALVVGTVIADGAVRSAAERGVADQLRSQLPAGVSAKSIDVRIGGPSILLQYLERRFEVVAVSSPAVVVNGAPIAATVVLRDVPLDLKDPVGVLSARASISQSALNRLVRIPNTTGSITVGSGVVGYRGTVKVLGLRIGYRAEARPVTHGTTVTFVPKVVSVDGVGGTVDVTGAVRGVVGDGSVCVARILPAGVRLTEVRAEPGELAIRLEGRRLVLDERTLATHDPCPR